MDIKAAFPLQLLINLARRQDRRILSEARCAKAGFHVERFPAVDARRKLSTTHGNMPRQVHTQCLTKSEWDELALADGPLKGLPWQGVSDVNDVRGYESSGRYALALTQRLALREAARRGAEAILLIEDDVIFHPNFISLIAASDLPKDWGIFYLGCTHIERPKWAGTRVVRVTRAVDTHAVAIRAPYYRKVMALLDRHGKPDLGVAKASDQFLSLLHQEVPTYASFPNLAWQDVSESDLIGKKYSNYRSDGFQKNFPLSVSNLLEEAAMCMDDPILATGALPQWLSGNIEGQKAQKKGCKIRRARLGLLFLTRGDVHHPQIWREFVAEAPQHFRIFSHPKYPEELRGGFLDGSAIAESYNTAWGDISLVRASRAMLLEALKDESLTHFALLSESCIPIRPLPEILRRLELDPRSQFNYSRIAEAQVQHANRATAVPEIPRGCWRFTSQWWLLNRVAAVFSAGADYTQLFQKMFVPDEAYFATVLSMQGFPLDGNVINKAVTWTSWQHSSGSPNSWKEFPQEKLEELLHSGALFARKFPVGADIGKFGMHLSPQPFAGCSLVGDV